MHCVEEVQCNEKHFFDIDASFVWILPIFVDDFGENVNLVKIGTDDQDQDRCQDQNQETAQNQGKGQDQGEDHYEDEDKDVDSDGNL